jgi:hypothetical protein
LGIWFDTKTLSWSYPEDKTEKVLRKIKETIKSSEVSLLDMQKLMGSLNDITLMCPFLKTFTVNLNETLGFLQRNVGKTTKLSCQAKKDLLIWVGFLQEGDNWKPISPRPMFPPLTFITMVSDAAGFQNGSLENVGVGNIGMDEEGRIVFASQIMWPDGMKKAVDSSGKSFGNKTTTLEMIGLVIPLLLCPEVLAGKHVVFRVDNIACYYGWKNKSVTGDKCASILMRAFSILSSYVCCYVHVDHLPRLSNWEATVCDRMSREKTTSRWDRNLLKSFGYRCPEILMSWLKEPTEDWELPMRLLEFVESKYE